MPPEDQVDVSTSRPDQDSYSSNHLRGILLEFGVTIPQGFASLLKVLPEILEDGDNELSDLLRSNLHRFEARKAH